MPKPIPLSPSELKTLQRNLAATTGDKNAGNFKPLTIREQKTLLDLCKHQAKKLNELEGKLKRLEKKLKRFA